jgi:transposase-like protein
MSKLPEVVSTIRRRRAWSVEEKVAILDAAFSKGGSVASAANAFDVSRSLIYIWRSQVRVGAMPGVAMLGACSAQVLRCVQGERITVGTDRSRADR